MGTGKLSLWRKRRRRAAEANLRPLLHPTLFAETRCHDRSENDLYDVCGERSLKATWLSVIDYCNCSHGSASRARARHIETRLQLTAGRRLLVQGMASGSACPTKILLIS